MAVTGQAELAQGAHLAAAPQETAASVALPPGLVQTVIDRLLKTDPEYLHYANGHTGRGDLVNFLYATPAEPHDPAYVFYRLRWGGVFIFAATRRGEVETVAQRFKEFGGFNLETPPAAIRKPFPRFLSRVHYFIARKVFLIPPGEETERFTYNVQLVRHTDPAQPLIVMKEVPTVESVVQRLRKRLPEVPSDVMEKRAAKFTERIFPTFLTREAGILMILQEHLPAPYNKRVPRVIDMEQDEKGFVRRLRMNWLRNGGEPLTQMEFARQSADLLRVLHDIVHVIHLDLRLDNFVITEDGVGFVDFGSSVREDEDLSKNPLLHSLFQDLMRTSQIQGMLEKMTLSGLVTSQVISSGYRKIDKAVDFFYLAVQFNNPHQNPDLAGLIKWDKDSRDAHDLEKLTAEILRPKDPANPTFRSAKDILHGIERIQFKLDQRRKQHI